jgi:hypothetical protein
MKLTEDQREEAKRQLVMRLEAAIEETPRAINAGEIQEAILKAATNQGVNMDNGEREIRMEIEDFEEMFKAIHIIGKDEYVHTIHAEPAELVITITKE